MKYITYYKRVKGLLLMLESDTRGLTFSVFLSLHSFSSLFLFASLLDSFFSLKSYFLSFGGSIVIPNPALPGSLRKSWWERDYVWPGLAPALFQSADDVRGVEYTQYCSAGVMRNNF